MSTARLLGAIQLLVFLGAMASERPLETAVGKGTISQTLLRISEHLTPMRIGTLVSLLTSAAIVVLGVLFFVAFHEQYRTVALVALAFFVAEGITLAVSKLGAMGLIPLSQNFARAGAPEQSFYQTLGDFLYSVVDRRGYDIHMLFFCLDGILWYALLVASNTIPRAISIWGLVAICLLTVPVLVGLYNRESTVLMILGLPYAPFEPVLGLWLLFRGFR